MPWRTPTSRRAWTACSGCFPEVVSGTAGRTVAGWVVGLRILFGLLLVVDAILEFQPGTYQVFDGIIYSNASASPEPLRSVLVLAAQVVAASPAVVNGALAGLEMALAISVLLGIGASLMMPLGMLLFLLIWVVGQGLGLPFAPGTTDLNSGLPYVIVLALLWGLGSWRRFSLWSWARPGGRSTPVRVRTLAALSMAGVIVLSLATFASVAAARSAPGAAGPGALGGSVLAYDAQINQDLLFGGCNALNCSHQTWLWAGRSWRPAPSPASLPLMGYAGATYDAAIQKVVMFGGAASQGLGPALADTWVWGQSWQRAKVAQPPPGRRFPALGYDPATRQLIMFGGDSAEGHPLGGTFVWGNGHWSRLHPADTPSPRTAASMAFDPQLGELVLYGGSNERSRLGDTWAWNGSDWIQVHSQHSPGPLAYGAMATDPQDGTVLLYAGAGAHHPTWQLGHQGWLPIQTSDSPPVFSFEAMAEAPYGRGVLLFGGGTSSGSGFSSATWLFSGENWSRVES